MPRERETSSIHVFFVDQIVDGMRKFREVSLGKYGGWSESFLFRRMFLYLHLTG